MSDQWNNRVSEYLDELEELAFTMEGLLEQTKIKTSGVDPREIQASVAELESKLVDLESKVAQREELIHDPGAPRKGVSLQQILRDDSQIERSLLAERVEDVAKTVSETNHKAIALFVCQYHLLDCSTHILRLLSGRDLPATYHRDAVEPSGGGLFNEAA